MGRTNYYSGVIAQLHFYFGWPKELLGAESSDWAFDVVAHLPHDRDHEHIACEVKKTRKELHRLVEFMRFYGAQLSLAIASIEAPYKASRENAYKKVVGLRKRRAPIFCGVGPDDETLVFQTSHGQDGRVTLEDAPLEMLAFPDSHLAEQKF